MVLADVTRELFAAHPFAARPPWTPLDEDAVEKDLHATVDGLRSALALEVQADFNHYGSGYASFVDAWFFREIAAFRKAADANHFTGLCVLLCRLAPYFCLLEGERLWHAKGSSSYIPQPNRVDAFPTAAVADLAVQVTHHLTARGFVRLGSAELSPLLPDNVDVPTVLTDPPYRRFDALFHWED